MENWTKQLEKLQRFKEIYGHSNVPLNWDNDRTLSQWVENIRIAKRSLHGELLHGLKKLDFNFEYKKEKDWKNLYPQLVSFREKFGHTRVPLAKPYEDLSEWTEKLRGLKRKLPDKQIRLLDELGFSWQSQRKRKNNWEFMFNELEKFRKEYGHTKVLRTDTEHAQLATWVANMRARHHLLSRDRKDRLTSIGFLWKEDIARLVEEQWLAQYEELKEFKKRFGHCNVPIKWKENGKLSQWVSENRLRAKNEGIIPKRRKLLEKIGFSWSEDIVAQSEERWDQMFKRLKEHKTKHGPIDSELKSWVMSQRIMLRRGVLSLKKQRRLRSIGFLWKDIYRDQWENMYQHLKLYMGKHGNTGVIHRKNHRSLAGWVVVQRKNYSNKTLSKERIKKLDKIGFIWANQFYEKSWLAMYHQLVDYKRKYGDANVARSTPKYRRLNRWVCKQRRRKVEGKLPDTEYSMLNKLCFDWDVRATMWKSGFEMLQAFMKQFNSLRIPEKTHPYLFRWISKQRQKFKNGKLTADRIKKLKGLGVDLKLRWTVNGKN